MLNLNELESKLNIALENETSESLTNWRLNIPQLEQQFDEILESFDSETLREWLSFAEHREKEECEQVVNDVVESK